MFGSMVTIIRQTVQNLKVKYNRVQVYSLLVGPIAQSVWRLSDELDGPGSISGREEIFRPSRPALRPTQPSVQWVPRLSRE